MPTGFRAMPVLPTRDVDASLAFYRDKMGFSPVNSWKDGDGPTEFAIVSLGTITLALQHAEDWHPVKTAWSAYLYIDDARALYAVASARGVETHGPPQETFYGMLEFEVRDPAGHWVAFGQDLQSSQKGPGL